MLSCFLSYANQYTKPFNDISSVVTEFQNALACAARIMEFIEEEPVPADPEGALQPSHLDGKVELQHIRFSYLPDRKLIEDLSVDVKPGMRVAIVGQPAYALLRCARRSNFHRRHPGAADWPQGAAQEFWYGAARYLAQVRLYFGEYPHGQSRRFL